MPQHIRVPQPSSELSPAPEVEVAAVTSPVEGSKRRHGGKLKVPVDPVAVEAIIQGVQNRAEVSSAIEAKAKAEGWRLPEGEWYTLGTQDHTLAAERTPSSRFGRQPEFVSAKAIFIGITDEGVREFGRKVDQELLSNPNGIDNPDKTPARREEIKKNNFRIVEQILSQQVVREAGTYHEDPVGGRVTFRGLHGGILGVAPNSELAKQVLQDASFRPADSPLFGELEPDQVPVVNTTHKTASERARMNSDVLARGAEVDQDWLKVEEYWGGLESESATLIAARAAGGVAVAGSQ